jgi:hypothetical protein
VQARLEDTAQCLLIIIGATPEGRKELVGLTDGVRESAQSWRKLLLDLKRRGLSIGPELVEASAHDERHRKLVRHGAPPHRALQGMSLKQTAVAMKLWRRLNGHNQLPKISPTESRLSDRKLKPLPPDPFRHQNSAIALPQ